MRCACIEKIMHDEGAKVCLCEVHAHLVVDYPLHNLGV